VKYAFLGPISIYLPEHVETNQQLQEENPSWDMNLIHAKTGIAQRHIAAPGQTASDLGVEASNRLFHEFDIDPSSIDFLLFCTQTPDYPLPTSACLMQQRLGLAQALLADAFGVARAHGAARATLSTDSRTGALDLYRRVGMQVESTWVHRATRP
jgi:3-oxoacyl-[acyl-carrier-protein] synthase III